jgi:hypothetical protein
MTYHMNESALWTLVNPDQYTRITLTEIVENPINVNVKWSTSAGAPIVSYLPCIMFNNKARWGAWQLLQKPIATSALSKFSPASGATYKRTLPLSAIENLPAEILSIIFHENVLSIDDALAFGLSSRIIWCHFLGLIQSYTKEGLQNSWMECYKRQYHFAHALVGQRIAFLCSKLEDLPPAFETDRGAGLNVVLHYLDWRNSNNMYPSIARPSVMIERARRFAYQSVDTLQTTLGQKVSDIVMKRRRGKFLAHWVRKAEMLEDLMTHASILRGLPADHPFVLRNLTAKQYFHITPGSGLDDDLGYVTDTSISGSKLTLDHALLLKICWTAYGITPIPGNRNTNPSAPRPAPSSKIMKSDINRPAPVIPWSEGLGIIEKVQKGCWAGHAFDIIPLSEFYQQLDAHEWRDITIEILNFAKSFSNTIQYTTATQSLRPKRTRAPTAKAKDSLHKANQSPLKARKRRLTQRQIDIRVRFLKERAYSMSD